MNRNLESRVSLSEIRAALEEILPKQSGSRLLLSGLRRRVSDYSSSYTIENLWATLSDGSRLNLVLKDLSPRSVLATAREIRPEFLYRPEREIETYRRVLGPLGLGTAKFYGAVEDVVAARYWLFLERVPGRLLWQLAAGSPWRDAAGWLARLHVAFERKHHFQEGQELAHLPRITGDFLRIWAGRAESFLSQRNLLSTSDQMRRFAKLIRNYDRVVDAILALPVSMIHGEFYPSNVLVDDTLGNRRICPVDWEMAAIGPGCIDLAMLTSGEWSETERSEMIDAYREARLGLCGTSVPSGELREAVSFCQLHTAIQMLGWSLQWSPPERHTQNWLNQAFRLADNLGL